MQTNRPQAIEVYKEFLPDGLQIEFLRVRGGNLDRGETQISLADFFLGKYPVTNKQYLCFVEETGSHHPEWMKEGNRYNIHTEKEIHYQRLGEGLSNDRHPIVGINWHNAL